MEIVEPSQGDVSKASSSYFLRTTDPPAGLALSTTQTFRNVANDSLENGKSDDSSQKKGAEGDAYSPSSLKSRSVRLLDVMPHENEMPLQERERQIEEIHIAADNTSTKSSVNEPIK